MTKNKVITSSTNKTENKTSAWQVTSWPDQIDVHPNPHYKIFT